MWTDGNSGHGRLRTDAGSVDIDEEHNVMHVLAWLDGQGFEYAVYHFDDHTNTRLTRPFELRFETRYYLLIYAKQRNTWNA